MRKVVSESWGRRRKEKPVETRTQDRAVARVVLGGIVAKWCWEVMCIVVMAPTGDEL